MGNCGSLPKTKGGVDVQVPAPELTTTKEPVETKEEEVKVLQQAEKKINGNVEEQNASGEKSGNENKAQDVGSLLIETKGKKNSEMSSESKEEEKTSIGEVKGGPEKTPAPAADKEVKGEVQEKAPEAAAGAKNEEDKKHEKGNIAAKEVKDEPEKALKIMTTDKEVKVEPEKAPEAATYGANNKEDKIYEKNINGDNEEIKGEPEKALQKTADKEVKVELEKEAKKTLDNEMRGESEKAPEPAANAINKEGNKFGMNTTNKEVKSELDKLAPKKASDKEVRGITRGGI